MIFIWIFWSETDSQRRWALRNDVRIGVSQIDCFAMLAMTREVMLGNDAGSCARYDEVSRIKPYAHE